jgi:hypothetical protein
MKYWLCCGSHSLTTHKDDCFEHLTGHPERRRFGTAEEHSLWAKEAYIKPAVQAAMTNQELQTAIDSLKKDYLENGQTFHYRPYMKEVIESALKRLLDAQIQRSLIITKE